MLFHKVDQLLVTYAQQVLYPITSEHYATLAEYLAADTGVQTLEATTDFLIPKIQKQYSYIISFSIYNVLAKVSDLIKYR
jgi:hypothetical protein